MDSPQPGISIEEGRSVYAKKGSAVTLTCNLHINENDEIQIKKFDQLKNEKGVHWMKDNKLIVGQVSFRFARKTHKLTFLSFRD